MSLLILLLAAPSVAGGQPRGFAGGAIASAPFIVSTATKGSPSTTYTNVGENGRLTGVVGEMGVFVKRRIAVGVEAWLPFERRLVTQEYGYAISQRYRRISSYRERMVFFAVHGRLNDSDRITAMWVGSGGLVFQDALERVAQGLPNTTTQYGPFGDLTDSTSLTIGGTGGAELSIQVQRHLSVVPQFRVVYIQRGDFKGTNASSFANLGLDRLTTRIGVSVRAVF